MVLAVEADPVANPLTEPFLLDSSGLIKIGALIFLLHVVGMERLRSLFGQGGKLLLGFETLRVERELGLLEDVHVLSDRLDGLEARILFVRCATV